MKLQKIMLLASLAAASAAVRADILVNTYGGSGAGFFPTVGHGTHAGQYLGKTFSIGSDYTLSQIDLAVRMFGESDQMLVTLRSDSSGQPTAILESFAITNQYGLSIGGNYTLTSTLNPLMTAGTYYVTIEPIADATGRWLLNNGAQSGAMVTSTDSGSSWTHFTDTNGAVRVHGVAAVPEPATMLALAGGVGLLLRRRRK